MFLPHMFSDINLEEIFEPSDLKEYKLQVSAIANELSVLNANLHILGKILSFRFDLFTTVDGLFWDFVEKALIESIILGIWKITIDPDRKVITLSKFQSYMVKNIKDNHKASLFKSLKTLNYKVNIDDIDAVIKEIRHNYVAHFNFKKNTRPTKEDIENRKIDWQELVKVTKSIVCLFNVLSFNQFSAYFFQYHPGVTDAYGSKHQNDIEDLLDSIAFNSELVNMPERQSTYWEAAGHSAVSIEDRKLINFYRSKMKLKEI